MFALLIATSAVSLSRRRFLGTAAASGVALAATPALATPLTSQSSRRIDAVRPPKLNPGDTVALVSPAGALQRQSQIDSAVAKVEALGLRAVVGKNALSRHGYLAGTDAQRAADMNDAFANPDVDGILAIRGGWGCARILPMVDWAAIRANPKALIGYSDLTSFLLAMYARTGVIGFHGPTGVSTFSPFTLASFNATVFRSEPTPLAPDTAMIGADGESITTIRAGRARGRLVGGNLTVLSAMVGTPWLPSFEGHILFLEDIGESVYRVDRMLTQVAQAGLLDGLTGFVFGSCRGCDPEVDAVGNFTLEEVVRQHVEPLGIPAIMGAPIGHITDKITVPVGGLAELDADAGTLALLEGATR